MTDEGLIGPVDPPGLHVMTYNIRRRVRSLRPGGPDDWTVREPLLRRILADEQPSLLGVQEALPDQAGVVADALGPSHRSVGRGRDPDGRGEGCPIFWDTRRLELTDWRQQALSATPERAGSRSWGNVVPRNLVSAEFTDRGTGTRLLAINTHFDHLSRRSRMESARRVAELAAAAHSRDPGAMIVMTGDINADATSRVHDRLTAGVLRDAWEVTEDRLTPQWRTYSGYRRPRVGGTRIDLILVGPGVEVVRCGINARRFGRAAASDHEPVQAVIRSAPRPSATTPPGGEPA